jgi:hypothetical protein
MSDQHMIQDSLDYLLIEEANRIAPARERDQHAMGF